MTSVLTTYLILQKLLYNQQYDALPTFTAVNDAITSVLTITTKMTSSYDSPSTKNDEASSIIKDTITSVATTTTILCDTNPVTKTFIDHVGVLYLILYILQVWLYLRTNVSTLLMKRCLSSQ